MNAKANTTARITELMIPPPLTRYTLGLDLLRHKITNGILQMVTIGVTPIKPTPSRVYSHF